MTTNTTLTLLDLQDTKDKKAVAVLDTSSLLMDGVKLLQYISNCTIVIPSVVISELEAKRTTTNLGFFAREWLRLLERLRVEHRDELKRGVFLEECENVEIRVEPNHTNQTSLPSYMQDGSNDATILAVAHNLNIEDENINVTVVSNDVPMRLKATLHLDMDAVEFSPSDVLRTDEVFDGTYEVILSEDDLENGSFDRQKISKNVESLALEALPDTDERSYHGVVNIQVEESGTSEHFALTGNSITTLQRKRRASNIVGRSFEQDTALGYLSDRDVEIISLGGRAGSGKTLLALAAGFEQVSAGAFQKVTVYKSLHEMGVGQEMGFLPGGVDEKMEAWAGAIYDAIDVLAASKKTVKKKSDTPQAEEAIKSEITRLRNLTEVMPIAYLRGRSLSNTYIILEEAQNFSRAEILNIISRVGEGSKLVMTWDADQVDNKYLRSGEQSDVWTIVESMRQEDVFAHITLSKTERSKVSELASRLLAEG